MFDDYNSDNVEESMTESDDEQEENENPEEDSARRQRRAAWSEDNVHRTEEECAEKIGTDVYRARKVDWLDFVGSSTLNRLHQDFRQSERTLISHIQSSWNFLWFQPTRVCGSGPSGMWFQPLGG